MEMNPYFNSINLDGFCADMSPAIRAQFYTMVLGHANNLVRRRLDALDPESFEVVDAEPPKKRNTPSHTFHFGTLKIAGLPEEKIFVTYACFNDEDGNPFPLSDRLESLRVIIE